MKNGLIAAALQRSSKSAPQDELRMTHEAIVEVMREEQEATTNGS